MYQEPEHNDYDDDEYNYYPEYNDYGYPKQFKFDWSAWEKWLSKTIKEITEEDNNVWIFGHPLKPSQKSTSDNTPSKGAFSDQYFMYLGKNHYDETLWKAKYFIASSFDQQYKNYLAANAAHILRQPTYYKNLFDNLN
jgi:hypothetical protein